VTQSVSTAAVTEKPASKLSKEKIYELNFISKRRRVMASTVPLYQTNYSSTNAKYGPAARASVWVYKVRWKGYNAKDDSWEPREYVSSDAFDEFARGTRYPEITTLDITGMLAIAETDAGFILKDEIAAAAAIAAVDAPRRPEHASTFESPASPHDPPTSDAKLPGSDAKLPGCTQSPALDGSSKTVSGQRSSYKCQQIPDGWISEAAGLVAHITHYKQLRHLRWRQ
jgi:hypothetical protein